MAQFHGEPSNLDTLIEAVGARRSDVRSALSSLHREGYVDVVRMRLTLAGFAIGRSLVDDELPPLRAAVASIVAA